MLSSVLWRRVRCPKVPPASSPPSSRSMSRGIPRERRPTRRRPRRRWRRCAAVIEAIAARHAGRVFNTAGDGFMLEFGSSLAAVEAAFELAEKCEPKVRVGVHLGDVVVQPNGDLLGHGVNVAARLMAQARAGLGADLGRCPAHDPRTARRAAASRAACFKLDKMAETIEAFALVAVASAIVAAQTQERRAAARGAAVRQSVERPARCSFSRTAWRRKFCKQLPARKG